MLQGNSTSFSEDFDLSVIDLEKAPDLVEKYQLKTAPVTIVEEMFFLNGEYGPQQLEHGIEAVKTGNSKKIVKNLLENRQKGILTEHLSQGTLSFEPLLDIITLPGEMQLRMGAMLVLQEMVEQGGKTGRKVLTTLHDSLDKCIEDPYSAEDLVYLLGQVGNNETIKILSNMLPETSGEMKEVVEEALESLA